MNSFLLLLLLPFWHALSFSPPHGSYKLTVPLHAYHFGKTAETEQNNKNTAQYRPKSTSYVPTGLTEEQYAEIKLKDSMKFQGDLGAWGPRWKKVSGDPQGNWFSMPGLWTGGYSRAAVGEEIPNWFRSNDDEIRESRRVLLGCFLGLRRFGLPYLMLLLSSGYAMLHKQFTMKWITLRIVSPLLVLKLLDVLVGRISPRKAWLRDGGVMKLSVVLGALVSTITFLLRR